LTQSKEYLQIHRILCASQALKTANKNTEWPILNPSTPLIIHLRRIRTRSEHHSPIIEAQIDWADSAALRFVKHESDFHDHLVRGDLSILDLHLLLLDPGASYTMQCLRGPRDPLFDRVFKILIRTRTDFRYPSY